MCACVRACVYTHTHTHTHTGGKEILIVVGVLLTDLRSHLSHGVAHAALLLPLLLLIGPVLKLLPLYLLLVLPVRMCMCICVGG